MTPRSLLDPSDPDVRIEFGMAEAEVAQHAQWRASAGVFRAIEQTLREATAHPAVFVHTELLSSQDAVEYAQRAAAADLAVRLNLAEGTVRTYGHAAGNLRTRMPQLWAWFGDGQVSTQNAREAATLVAELPEEHWAAFDSGLVEPAQRLTPPRFRLKARALRDRLIAADAAERHARAAEQRHMAAESDRDGMGWLNAYLPMEQITLIEAHIGHLAYEAWKLPEQTRTMTQLRADLLADLLTGKTTGTGAGVTVALTIPMLTLLGQSDQPATLEGVGPIDLDTARALCAGVPSITRMLTDPVTDEILHLDPTQYRTTKKLQRFLAQRDVTCTFPGCGRRALDCDIDHILARQHGGTTIPKNLHHLCRKHHRLKHISRWKIARTEDGTTTWTSPTGNTRNADPPPF